MARTEIKNIPEWAHQAATQWCEERTGGTLAGYLRSVIVGLANDQLGKITVQGSPIDIGKYQKLCIKEGSKAEIRLMNFIRSELDRYP